MNNIMIQLRQDLLDEFDKIPASYKISDITMEECMVKMSDGIGLKTYIFKVAGDLQMPVLLKRSCYPNFYEMDTPMSRELVRKACGNQIFMNVRMG